MAFPSRQKMGSEKPVSPFKAPARLQAYGGAAPAGAMDHRTADPLEIRVSAKPARMAEPPATVPAPGPQVPQNATIPAPSEMVPGPSDDYTDDDYTSLDGIDPLDDGPDMGVLPGGVPDLQPMGSMTASAVPMPADTPVPMEEGLDESEFLPTVRNASLEPTLSDAQAADYSVPAGDSGLVGETESKKRGGLFAHRGGKKTSRKNAAKPIAPSHVPAPSAPAVAKPVNDVDLPGLPTGDVPSMDETPAPARRRHAGNGSRRGRDAGKTAGRQEGVSLPVVLGLSIGSSGAVLSVPLLAQAVSTLTNVPFMAVFLGLSTLVIVVALALGFVSLKKSTAAGAVTIVLALLMALVIGGYVYALPKVPMPISSEPALSESSGKDVE